MERKYCQQYIMDLECRWWRGSIPPFFSHCCHIHTIFLTVPSPYNNCLGIKWSLSFSKSLSLNLYSHFQPFWMFLHTHSMCSKRFWITSHVPHSRDTGFLSASVQEDNITNNTQLSRPHIMVAIWVLNSFSKGCFLLLEKIIQLCFLLHRCWSSWIL